MTKLEALYEFADDNAIDIINGAFSQTKKAACLHLKPDKLIVLDVAAMESKAEEVAILCEEIGHFETGALYVINSTYNTKIARNNRIKYEAQARHWAYNKCCTPCEIETAFKQEGVYGESAVAEYCQVTVGFLHKAIEYHRSCGVTFSFDNNGDCA